MMGWQDWWDGSAAAMAAAASTAALVAALALVALRLVRRAVRTGRALLLARAGADAERAKRIDTLARVFHHVASLAAGVVGAMLLLAELGVSMAPILGAAGVVGIAVGFGAQSLVKDFFTGFFVLQENQIRTGDVVEVAGHAGLVEEVTLRYVRLRDFEGTVHFVPTGLITTIKNMSLDHAYAVVDAGVAYREDVDAALEVMRAVGERLAADAAWAERITGPVQVVGVERWDDWAVVLRCRLRVAPLVQWEVRREWLRRLKRAFDDAGIEIPYPHLTVYAGADRTGQAPALPLRLVPRRPAAGPR